MAVAPGDYLDPRLVIICTGEPDMPDERCMASVEAFSQPEEGREDHEHRTLLGIEFEDPGVFLLRGFLPVEPGKVCHEGHFALVKPEEFGVPDDIVGMGVVVIVRDERAYVVEKGCVLQEFALVIAQCMQPELTG